MQFPPRKRPLRARLTVGVVAVLGIVILGGYANRQVAHVRHPFAADTTYQRRLAYQEQLSHAVPTDSLMHLWVRLADASTADAGPLAGEISCEMTRLAMRHGSIPADKADRRATDSLAKAQPEALARARAKFNSVPPGVAAINSTICHTVGWRPAPDSVSLMPMPTEIEKKYRKKP
jgi:hypothetical protein